MPRKKKSPDRSDIDTDEIIRALKQRVDELEKLLGDTDQVQNSDNIYAQDVSRLKQAEFELRTHRDQLELRFQERTGELINANQELRQNDELLSQILEALPVGVLITNENGKIILANPASRSIWASAQYVGIEQYGEYKGRWFENGRLIGLEEWAAARAIRKGETSINEEIEIESFDGKHKIINNSAVPIRSGGKIIGAIIVVQDITRRKQSQKALMHANELLEKVFSSVDIHIAYMDCDFNYLRVNRAFAWSDQHEPEFYPGKNHFVLFPNPENQAIFQHVVETGVPYTVYETPYVLPNSPGRGVTYWDWSLQPVKDENDIVQGVIYSLVDVTERKVDDDLIHQSMERASVLGELSRTLAEAGPDYEAVLDAITNAITRLLGDTCVIRLVSEDGHWLEMAAAYDQDPRIIQVLRQYDSTVRISSAEGLSGLAYQKGEGILLSPGEVMTRKTSLSLLYGPLVDQIECMMAVPVRVQGRIIGVISLSRRKPATAYTKDDLKFLQSLSDRASMAIVNARLYRDLETSLRQEQAMRIQLIQAEKLSALARMVASVSHELNNPIQTIRNCMFLLQQEIPKDSSTYELLTMAVSEATRISNLVVQLREIYKPPASNVAEPFNITEALLNVQTLMGTHLHHHKVQWQNRDHLEGVIVNGIADQIKQVFMNVAFNAIEAMDPEGGTLFVDVSVPTDRKEVCIKFTDTGPGILPKDMPRVFEPFFTTKEKGSGLGLSICYEILISHDGRMTVESPPGQGAAFSIWLPVCEIN
jgi:signal transduction histidine kinase